MGSDFRRMVLEGRHLEGQLQFPTRPFNAPPPGLDFPQVEFDGLDAAHNIDAMLGPTMPAQQTLVDRLKRCKQSPERDSLIAEYTALSERIDDFLAEHRAAHIRELEAHRDGLWARARETEDAVKEKQARVGYLRTSVNGALEHLGDWKQKFNEARGTRPGKNTAFPTQQEVLEWSTNIAAIGSEVKIAENTVEQFRSELRDAVAEQQQTQRQLQALVLEIEGIDNELAGRPSRGPHGLIHPPSEL